ncbi:MAG: aldehyde dehydrogenase family protein [Actinomycetota bacterium]
MTSIELPVRYTDEALPADVARLLDVELSRAEESLPASEARGNHGREVKTWAPWDQGCLVGSFPSFSASELDALLSSAAVAAAAWADTRASERAERLRVAAKLLQEHRLSLAASIVVEVGKSKVESLAEVNETIAFAEYYANECERLRDAFDIRPGVMSGTRLRPYGTWGIVGPFNFPIALTGGPMFAAIAAGNAVIVKPSPMGSLCGQRLTEVVAPAFPSSLVSLATGGKETGNALVQNPGIAGVTFTGSFDVGMDVARMCLRSVPKPFVCEMGGKNAATIMPSADLSAALQGVVRAAFSYAGQKCSSCSRLLVHRTIVDSFTEQLIELTESLAIGDPRRSDATVGPLIDARAVSRYGEAVAASARDGEVLVGGTTREEDDLSKGNYVSPTVVKVPTSSKIWRDELFLPLLSVQTIDSLEEAISLSNQSPFGLTAGLFTNKESEAERFLSGVQAGFVNVNRRAGATTGGWPGEQPFGGWRASGNTGKLAGGPWYLPLYSREQMRNAEGLRA